MRKLQTLQSQLSRLNTRYLLMPLLGLLSAPVFAGSDTTFQSMVDWIQDKLTGSMGLLLALIALVIAIISSAMGQFKAFYGGAGGGRCRHAGYLHHHRHVYRHILSHRAFQAA